MLFRSEEKIKFLVTFSKNAKVSFGDDDYRQILYLVVPEKQRGPVFIRVFDPNVGGKHDEKRNSFNSKTQFSVYGGSGVHVVDKIRKGATVDDPYSGILIATKTFDATAYDDDWFTFGPFNPAEGELQPDFGGYVFKLVVEGLDGDDGNLYKLFLSSRKDKNTPIDGGNCFYYECCFRLSDELNSISHIYPFISQNIIKVHINVFDYDNDGTIRLISVAKNGLTAKSDKDGDWTTLDFDVEPRELNTSLDIQFIKTRKVKNNNVVVFVTNQEKSRIPFFTIPIGGVPKYKPAIVVVPGN